MKYATVCSGIEAPTVAWHDLGWKPVFFSEIERFPSDVLDFHYPSVPNLGDMTKINAADYYGAVDLICGGTPCQSFSVAGLRKGLDDPRGNLALVFLSIVDRICPTWVVWENVPGVLSSNGGRDFGAFIGALGELGYGWAYRTLDAQHFGVPQRRRRVFVVGHIGGQHQRAAAVLFDSTCMRRDFAPGRSQGKAVAADAETGVTERLHGGIDYEYNGFGVDEPCGPLIKGSPTGGGHPLPAVVMTTGQANAEIAYDGSPALTCNHEAPIVAFHGSQDPDVSGDISHPLGTNKGREVCVAFGVGESSEVAHCLRADASRADKHESTTYIAQSTAVRRITPTEAERLQGFPDNYTLIPGRQADGPRYKALGNSMAVPVMRWIGQRIQFVNSINYATT